MPIPLLVIRMFLVGLMGIGAVSGQSYPNKPLRIFTSEPGGGSDFMTRIIAQGLTVQLGQQIVVENRPSGVIVGDAVAKATPDGYTLLYAGGSHWLLPFMRDDMPFDPVRDFSPITLAVISPNVLVVHPALPVKSVKELIALARAKPGELNYSSGTPGTSSHLAAALFNNLAGVNIVRVPYKGGGPALNALLAGEVQLHFGTAASVMSHIKSSRLRVLAVSTPNPSALFPELPTVAATGLPGYEANTLFGLFVPAKTPAVLINRLNQESVRVLNRADVKEKFFSSGLEVVGSTPAEFAAAIKSDMALLGKVIKEAGIRAD